MRDESAPAGFDLNETDLLETAESFAHCGATDLECLAELFFHDPLAHFQFTAKDGGLNGFHYAVLCGLNVDPAHGRSFCGGVHNGMVSIRCRQKECQAGRC